MVATMPNPKPTLEESLRALRGFLADPETPQARRAYILGALDALEGREADQDRGADSRACPWRYLAGWTAAKGF